MVLQQFSWFIMLMAVHAQMPPPVTNEPLDSFVNKDCTGFPAPTKILSYDPNEVCFNPQYTPYFKNDLLATSPIPKANIYNNIPAAPDVSCPNSLLPKFRNPWPDYRSKNFIPLVYIPSIPNSGHVDIRTLHYLKDLKKALNTNPLLATRDKKIVVPKNRIEIKFNSFPSADSLPEDLIKKTNCADLKSIEKETHGINDEKAQKIASYLIKYAKRKKRDLNPTNEYPLPKVVYAEDRDPQPKSIYNSRRLFVEIYN